MFITNHVLAGALIGSLLPPVPAVAVGFASHLVMDNLPHYGEGGGPLHLPTARKDGLLGLAGIAFCTVLTPAARRPGMLAGIFGACLPDTDKLGDHFIGRSPWPAGFDRFHKWIQREAPNRLPIEVLTGTGLALLAIRQLRR
ncbi:MAG TPA: hypothetical protein VLR26_05225 [Frankiaceae bacterium]|nr:hypothetical protein [Frankiaceae bacterium]